MSSTGYGPEPRPIEERFWEKVDASGDCWEWTAGTSAGYGKFYSAGKGMVRAHRFIWELLVGAGLEQETPETLPLPTPEDLGDQLDLVTILEQPR